jgi:ribosomal protein L21E
MVESAYQGIIGWRAAGRHRPYASKLDCAQQCPEVRQVLSDSGVTIDTLFKRIEEVHPNFHFKKLRIRWKLTDANKQERDNICQQLLQEFRHLLHRVVFVDAKTVWMWEEEIWGWVDTSVPNFCQGIKPAYSQGKIIHLKYYAAVHSKLGPLWIKFYTGTTGMAYNHDGHNFKVGSCSKQLGQAFSLHMHHCLLQLLGPHRLLSRVTCHILIHPQPQHTPPLLHCSPSIQPVPQVPFSQAAVNVVGLGQ